MKIIREHSQLSSVFPAYYSSLPIDRLKLSQYTEANHVDDNNIVLYSYVTDAIILLTQCEYESLSNMDFSENTEFFESLRENGFFVDVCVDELELMCKQRENMSSNVSQMMKVVIMPTTDCNARCRYCIGSSNKRIKMTLDTARQVVNYIVERAANYKSIRFDWYGGEPLMESDVITYICEEVNKRLPDKAYSSVITTNLALFDENLLKKAVDIWHIKKVNVTIDGTEQEHNARKNYLNRTLNGYRHTLECIRILLDNDINVFCRFNIDRNNEGELPRVLDELQQFNGHNLFYFFVSPLRGSDCHSEFYATSEYNELFFKTGELMHEKGFKNAIDSFVPKVALGFCVAKNKNCFVVGPTGELFRCNLDDLDQETATGNVVEGLDKNAAYNTFIDLKLDERCTTCRYLPICQGGCPTEKKFQSSSNDQCLKFKFKTNAISKLLVDYYC